MEQLRKGPLEERDRMYQDQMAGANLALFLGTERSIGLECSEGGAVW